MVNVVGLIVLIFLAAVLAGALLPTAFNSIFNANTSSWDSGTVSIWNVLPILFIIAVIIAVLAVVGLKVSGKI